MALIQVFVQVPTEAQVEDLPQGMTNIKCKDQAQALAPHPAKVEAEPCPVGVGQSAGGPDSCDGGADGF